MNELLRLSKLEGSSQENEVLSHKGEVLKERLDNHISFVGLLSNENLWKTMLSRLKGRESYSD